MAKGPSYGQIARETGLSVSFVSRVMRGERRPSVDSLSLLARTLGVSTDTLLCRLEKVRKGRDGDKDEKGGER